MQNDDFCYVDDLLVGMLLCVLQTLSMNPCRNIFVYSCFSLLFDWKTRFFTGSGANLEAQVTLGCKCFFIN